MAAWRPAFVTAVGALLLAGCTGGADDGAGAEKKPKSAPSASPSPTEVSEPYTLAEERAPKTRAEAVAYVRDLDVRPDYFGTGYRKREPFQSDPAEWAVLGADCLWRREPLADTVLASLTRAFELPQQGAKKPVYLSLTVTVHENVVAARRDMAGSLESALRCREQRLNATERVRGLYSQVSAYTDARSPISEDDLSEVGEWVVDGQSGAHPFDWYKFRLGPVTVAATTRHGAGRTQAEDSAVTSDMIQGLSLVAAEINRQGAADGSDGSGAPSAPTETKGAER
jgi:hypothetical protein